MKTFIYLLIFSLIKSSYAVQDHLERGSSLSVEDDSHHITSLDNTLTCGFYGFQNNAYWVAIWYTNSNTTSTYISRAMLLNTGYFILKNQNDDFVWQRFDYPTDTLLPSQTLTKSKSLISASRKSSFESGYYGLMYSSINVLKFVYDGPEISSVYCPSPGYNVWAFGRTSYNSSRIASFTDLGVFNSSDRWYFCAMDMGYGIKRRLTLDYDGNLRFYSLNDSSGLWSVSWQAIAQPCNIHGHCVRHEICVNGENLECVCPPGYEQNDPTDLSQGCKPYFNQTCVDSTKFEFVEMLNTYYYGFDLNFTSPVPFKACWDICLGDCRCEAFNSRLTGEGLCVH